MTVRGSEQVPAASDDAADGRDDAVRVDPVAVAGEPGGDEGSGGDGPATTTGPPAEPVGTDPGTAGAASAGGASAGGASAGGASAGGASAGAATPGGASAGAARGHGRGGQRPGDRTGALPGGRDQPGTRERLEAAVGEAVRTADGSDSHYWRPRLALTLAVGLAGGFLLASLAGAIIGRIRPLLISIAVALFISFGLEPAVKWMHDRGLSRGLATGVVFLLSLLAVAGFFAAMVPLIVSQVMSLVDTTPDLLAGLSRQAESLPGDAGERISEWLDGLQEDLPSNMTGLAGTAGRRVLDLGASVAGSVFNMLTIALVAFYLAADGPKLRRALSSSMKPSTQHEFLQIWDIAIEKTGGYLYSRVLTAVTSTVFHTAVFWLLDLEYAFALGVWVGVVSSIVPVVGTYLGGMLPLVIALASSVADAAWVLGTIVVYQQVENYIIAPRITAHTVSLHPAVAFLAVLAGAALLGAVGALLAIPAAAIVASLWSARRDVHEVVDHDLTAAAPWLQRPE